MSLADMERDGKLKKHTPSKVEVNRLLMAIQRRLEDAKNPSSHNETRFEQAYEAILLCSKVALLVSGYRMRQREGYHYESINSLHFTLQVAPEVIEYYQVLRQKRHKGLYEGLINVRDSELIEATIAAEELRDKVTLWLKTNHPHVIGE